MELRRGAFLLPGVENRESEGVRRQAEPKHQLPDQFVLETKSTKSPGAADRYLWQAGIRPDTISKYGTGLAALDPALPSNKWHRTLQRHFS